MLTGKIRGLERNILRHLKEVQVVLALMLVVSALVFPLHQPASAQSLDTSAPWPMFRQNSRHTGLSPYDTSDNPGSQKWVFSTGGSPVTEPGEGVFPYDGGTVVDLVASPDEGYQFDSWTGDVGIKAGDWIKIEYTITGLHAGQLYPEWLKLEFLSVEGTIANVRATLHISDGTEQSDTGPVDVVSGSEFPGLAGIVISANLTTGDSVYIVGYGNVTIESEATRTYAGVNRTIVYVSFSQNETQVTYYWDKLTGVMVELSSTSPDISANAKATETNMWEATEATTARMLWWPWIIVAVVAVGLVVFFMCRRRKVRKKALSPREQLEKEKEEIVRMIDEALEEEERKR